MNGMAIRERDDASQVVLETSARLLTALSGTRGGRRWVRIVRAHAGELEALMTVHDDLRAHMARALSELAGDGTDLGWLDGDTVLAVSRVLDDLQRLGGISLQLAVAGLREELAMARGRRLAAVLAG